MSVAGALDWFGALAFLLGALTGFSEIVSRYRDEPLRAGCNPAGFAYMLFNGAIALGAYALLGRYDEAILPGLADDPFLLAMAAGFGAMALFRSKFFIFRTDDGREYPIGPSIVLESLLRLIDRNIDRRRAARRQALVVDLMSGIDGYEKLAQYLLASLLSFQNLTTEERTEIAATVKRYGDNEEFRSWPENVKVLALGFAFLTLAGEEHFAGMVNSFRRGVGLAERPPASAAERLMTVFSFR
jgi:hypothetical protein